MGEVSIQAGNQGHVSQSRHAQGEFRFQAGAAETGYTEWVVARQMAIDVVAQKLNLPLGHAVELWLRGGIRLRGKLRLFNEVLFIEEKRIPDLALIVDGVSFTYSELESCVRQD